LEAGFFKMGVNIIQDIAVLLILGITVCFIILKTVKFIKSPGKNPGCSYKKCSSCPMSEDTNCMPDTKENKSKK